MDNILNLGPAARAEIQSNTHQFHLTNIQKSYAFVCKFGYSSATNKSIQMISFDFEKSQTTKEKSNQKL